MEGLRKTMAGLVHVGVFLRRAAGEAEGLMLLPVQQAAVREAGAARLREGHLEFLDREETVVAVQAMG
jgi:hypothetical protein